MRKKEATLSSLKNRISLRLKYDKNASHACLAHMALVVVISGLVALCGVNTFLSNNVPLQSVVSAAFCVSAGLLYAVYMIISKLLALVLNYAERRSKHSYYDFTIENGDYEEGMIAVIIPRNLVLTTPATTIPLPQIVAAMKTLKKM
jgi:hypothetical protein